MRRLLTFFFGVLVAAAPAAAQDYKPVDVNFGFGWAFPTTDFKNEFDSGWTGTFGVTFNMNPHLGIQGEYTYARMEGPDKVIQVSSSPIGAALTNGLIESNHQMHVGTVNLVYKGHSSDHPIGGYVLGGLGLYHRIVQLTSPSVGYATVCDPYWYVCYPALVPIDTIIGDRSSNDFGINFGGGITFGHDAKFYIESRYHYVWGQSISPVAGNLPAGGSNAVCSGGCSTNAGYFPITFGLRW